MEIKNSQNINFKCYFCFNPLDKQLAQTYLGGNSKQFFYIPCTFNPCYKKNYFHKCKCGQLCPNNDSYKLGENISCIFCSKNYQYLICPTCFENLYWNNGVYEQGKFFTCSCKAKYQHVNCPNCDAANFWELKPQINQFYVHGKNTTCWQCKKDFKHLSCPFCKSANYLKDEKYLEGTVVKCQKIFCGKNFQHVNCPHCQYPIYYDNEKFYYLNNIQCEMCNYFCMFYPCPTCAKVESISNLFEISMPNKFFCKDCNQYFKLLSCEKCKNVMIPDLSKGICSEVSCFECKNKKKLLICGRCNELITCNKSSPHSKFHFCPACEPYEFRPIRDNLNNNNNIISNNINNNINNIFFNNNNNIINHTNNFLFSNNNNNYNSSANERLSLATNYLRTSIRNNNRERIGGGLFSNLFDIKNNNTYSNPTDYMNNFFKDLNVNKDKDSEDKDKEKLEEKALGDDKFKCKICFENDISRVFIRCKHACICEKCEKKIVDRRCPICREVSNVEKFYL